MEKLDPAKFHYWERDSRRSVPPIQVIYNPAFGRDGRLLGEGELKALKGAGEAAASGEVEVNGVVGDEVTKPPTKKYQYRVADEQPPATGYFTITNVR